MNKKLQPSGLRLFLVIIILLISAGTFGVISFGLNELGKLADETRSAASKAKASENNIAIMESIKKRYEQISDITPIIDKMVASQNSYRYQDNTINVLNHYANLAGLRIDQMNFSLAKNVSANLKAGSNSVLASINLINPTSYDSFIKFMRLVEGGLSQMQILQVEVRKEKDSNITTGQMVIAIYVKEK